MPKVSVVMPVYNGEDYLAEAVDSILNQDFKDFEFLIIDDGSGDSTPEIIKQYASKDSRVIYIQNEQNLGISKTLNKGIKQAKGQYIARMDADDIALAERFSIQVDFLDRNPAVGICGSWWLNFGDRHDTVGHPYIDEKMKVYLLSGTCFGHPTVMIRKELFVENNLWYDCKFDNCEDYELWFRFAAVTKFANIPKVLLKYRIHNAKISSVRSESQSMIHWSLVYKTYEELLKRDLSDSEKLIISKDSSGEVDPVQIQLFLKSVYDKNLETEIYNSKILKRHLANVLLLNLNLRHSKKEIISILLKNRYFPFLTSCIYVKLLLKGQLK